jgi:hypothetical protein
MKKGRIISHEHNHKYRGRSGVVILKDAVVGPLIFSKLPIGVKGNYAIDVRRISKSITRMSHQSRMPRVSHQPLSTRSEQHEKLRRIQDRSFLARL